MKEKEEKMYFPKIDDFFITQEERDAELFVGTLIYDYKKKVKKESK